MRILVTGCAGFIGFHLAKRLLDGGEEVLGVANLSAYYAVELMLARLRQIEGRRDFKFFKLDIADRSELPSLFHKTKPQRVAHLAAQAGVRYSLTNPHGYVDSNLVGSVNMLEDCRTMASSIWFMRRRVQCMGQTQRCLSPFTRTWTTPSASMRRPRRQTN